MTNQVNNTEELTIEERLNQYKSGDVVSVYCRGRWFIQWVETVSVPTSKKPSLWCVQIMQLPYKLPLEDEGKTWIKGIHESILKAVGL
ncbi:hypothetical protein [Acinetobacter baumannii]|uniref:hypothetical protein n=1 Tax=Acinetobacter baumannii TaxID=470 RepID=UPI0008DE2E90|nr:hypothetical protein [Acinetobacter baumannii]MCE6930382.1 hypothetical protein [Acinetobacter baumannii]MCZ0638471.1 hypothetical protein [Acinetobacter baumannii]MVO43823.1 hypothetical protein [Acinetobacter baumannii]OIB66667.1 hypothetical protein A7L34_12535 [Acinetobacter baumannii]OIE93346.1 hypothetical protein A7L81_19515 [Acinetobacter baumannii]